MVELAGIGVLAAGFRRAIFGAVKANSKRDSGGEIVCDPDASPKLGVTMTNAEQAEHSAGQPAAPNGSTDQKSGAQRGSGWGQFVSAHWREIVSIVIELAGIGVMSAGFWLISPRSGLIVLGAGLIVIGFASSPRFDKPRQSQ